MAGQWLLFFPEIIFLLGGLVFVLISMFAPGAERGSRLAATVLAVGGLAGALIGLGLDGSLFGGLYRVDLFSQAFKVMLAMGLFLVAWACDEPGATAPRQRADFYLLLWLATAALMMLVSSVEFLTLFVALEISSYCLYCLVPLRRDGVHSFEAGVKFFLVGITASAMMLFGLALVYGASGTTQFAVVRQVGLHSPGGSIGMVMVLCGLFFKLAVFPFHFWAPDVYQGAANQAATYIATVSKVAAMAVVVRLAEVSAGTGGAISKVLLVLAVACMSLGNLAALGQRDLKRLLAYSSIAHAGYVLVGILVMSADGYAGAIYYAAAYLVLNLSVFMVVAAMAPGGANLAVADLAGLHRREPALALLLMVALFGLAGIPPTAGFTGKFLVFVAAIRQGYFFLVVVAMINVVISLYYYLMVIRAAYLLEPGGGGALAPAAVKTRITAVGLVLVIVVLGLFPRPLLQVAEEAAATLLR